MVRRGLGRAWKGLERVGSRAGLGRLRRIPGFERLVFHTLQKAVHRVSRAGVAQVRGHRMRLDEGDHLRLSLNGEYEPFATSLVERLVKPGTTVVDVGANIGYYTLLLARAVGPAGRVVAFEPHPKNLGILRENVAANGYGNVELHQAALGREAGDLELHVHASAGGHSLRRIEGASTLRVRTLRLDDAVPGPIDFLKMDVEGAEGLVLAGATRLLDASPRLVILMEYTRPYLDATAVGAEATLRLLADRGFRLYVLDDRNERLEPVTVEALLAREIENVLCARQPLDDLA